MKIAVEGCAHGELERIYDTIQGIEKTRNIKIDLLLCCGDFQSTRNLEDLQTMAVPKKFMDMCTFYKYYSGELTAPILTIFIGGNHEASNYLQELPYGGWVAPNIYYLGYAGVVNVNGIRIAGISGIYKGHDFLRGHHEFPPYTDSTCRSVYHVRQLEVFRMKQLSGKIDVFMSHDWPSGIYEYGNKTQLLRKKPFFRDDIESGQLGSRPMEELLNAVQPEYWFAAHLHCKFAALVPHFRQRGKTVKDDELSSDSDDDSENSKSHQAAAPPEPNSVTKFLALDKCLPRRGFLQVLDLPTATVDGRVKLEYDVEWLAILFTTNHLTSVKNNNYYLPGKKAGHLTERFDYTPTAEELAFVQTKFESLEVPENFCRTVPPYDANEHPNYKNSYISKPNAQLNPQSTTFCAILGIDDPLCLAMLASGKELPKVATVIEESNIDSKALLGSSSIEEKPSEDSSIVPDLITTPMKRKINLSLPAPATPTTSEVDQKDIDLPSEHDFKVEKQEQQSNETANMKKSVQDITNDAGPITKQFKRRNQSIYQTEENDS